MPKYTNEHPYPFVSNWYIGYGPNFSIVYMYKRLTWEKTFISLIIKERWQHQKNLYNNKLD